MKERIKNKGGFTLVELVIVIAVLAILAAIIIPTVTSVIASANQNTDRSNAQQIEMSLKNADAMITGRTAAAGSALESIQNAGTGRGNTTVQAVLTAMGVNCEVSGTAFVLRTTGTGWGYYYSPSTHKVTATDTKAKADALMGTTDASTTPLAPGATMTSIGYTNW